MASAVAAAPLPTARQRVCNRRLVAVVIALELLFYSPRLFTRASRFRGRVFGFDEAFEG